MIDISDPATRERFIQELAKLRANRAGRECLCVGPQSGEPMCPCKMQAMRDDFEDALRAYQV